MKGREKEKKREDKRKTNEKVYRGLKERANEKRAAISEKGMKMGGKKRQRERNNEAETDERKCL